MSTESKVRLLRSSESYINKQEKKAFKVLSKSLGFMVMGGSMLSFLDFREGASLVGSSVLAWGSVVVSTRTYYSAKKWINKFR